jgi:hypothetical protein
MAERSIRISLVLKCALARHRPAILSRSSQALVGENPGIPKIGCTLRVGTSVVQLVVG